MPNKKHLIKFFKKAIICFVALTTILMMMGFPLGPIKIMEPKVALAQAPSIGCGHMPIEKMAGKADFLDSPNH